MTEERIKHLVARDMLRAAEAKVTKAKRRVARAEDKMQVALDERNEADEALSEANYQLHIVKMSLGI